MIYEHDVVIKSVPSQPYLSIREHAFSQPKMSKLYREVTDAVVCERVKGLQYGMALFHDPVSKDKNIDWELGFLLDDAQMSSLVLDGERQLTLRTLPEVEEMATVVHKGPWPE